jgi:hypothetical protein
VLVWRARSDAYDNSDTTLQWLAVLSAKAAPSEVSLTVQDCEDISEWQEDLTVNALRYLPSKDRWRLEVFLRDNGTRVGKCLQTCVRYAKQPRRQDRCYPACHGWAALKLSQGARAYLHRGNKKLHLILRAKVGSGC